MKKFLLSILLLLPSFAFAGYDLEVERSVPRDSKVNVQIYVPSLIVGMISGDINVKLNEKFTLGPQATYFAYGDHRGYELGLTANYALAGDVFDDRTWLVNPYVLYSHSDLSFDGAKDGKVKKGGVVGGLNLVYQWMWNSGVNMRAGIGAYYSTKKILLGIGNSNIGGTLMFSIGYAF